MGIFFHCGGSSPKGRLRCSSAFVQMYELSFWDDIDVKLKVILSAVVDDGVGEMGGEMIIN